MGSVFHTSNCNRRLLRLANSEVTGEQLRLVGSEKPQEVGRSWGSETSSGGGRGSAKGDGGRRRWWSEAAASSASMYVLVYLLRRFFNGKLRSAVSGKMEHSKHPVLEKQSSSGFKVVSSSQSDQVSSVSIPLWMELDVILLLGLCLVEEQLSFSICNRHDDSTCGFVWPCFSSPRPSLTFLLQLKAPPTWRGRGLSCTWRGVKGTNCFGVVMMRDDLGGSGKLLRTVANAAASLFCTGGSTASSRWSLSSAGGLSFSHLASRY